MDTQRLLVFVRGLANIVDEEAYCTNRERTALEPLVS